MRDEVLRAARIFLVDDQEANLRLLERMLGRAGYTNLWTTSDSRTVRDAFADEPPDLLVLDLQMPNLDGFGVMEQIAPLLPEDVYSPILVVTADISPESKQRALSSGARDFLTKPFDQVEAMLRIRNLLETRFLHLELKRQNERLEERVRERTTELERARLETLERLARAAEYRDDDTGQHARRVGDLSALLARELGLSEADVELIRRAAPLHDIGKIGIPDSILLTPRQLTAAERSVIQTHTEIGAQILSGGTTTLLRMAEQIARYHHEHWDGSGYLGLVGDAIPIVGRIVAVADTFDALTHERPYKRAWSEAEALEEIQQLAGRRYDPAVVEVLVQVRERGGGIPAAHGA